MNKFINTTKNNFINSKFSFTKNFLKFLAFPALVLLAGIILCVTVGFNLGTDFSGGVTFKVYANYEQVLEGDNILSYDLNEKQDYDEMKDKVVNVLNDNGLKVVSYRKTTMDISEYNIFGGQAVEVVYQNSDKSLNDVREQILQEFGYMPCENAVTSFDTMQSLYSFDYVIGIVAAVVFGLIATIIYLTFRFDHSALLVSILHVAFDMFMIIGMLLITRLTVNLNVSVILLTTFLLSIANLIYFYASMKTSIKQGKFEKVKPSVMADTLTKELTFKKIFVNLSLMIIFVLLASLIGGGIREVSLGIIIALLVTFYSSECIMPSLWATISSTRKKKKMLKTIK